MSQIERIKQAIMSDPQNASYTERGIEPLFAAPKTARINIIGQAPGLKTQEAGLYWKDKSGARLRDWLGVDEDTFTIQDILLFCLWISTFQGMASQVIYHLEQGLPKNGILALARITRYSIDPLDWTICPGLLFKGESQWQGDRTGKTLPELSANLFSTDTPLTAKSNLDGQKSLV